MAPPLHSGVMTSIAGCIQLSLDYAPNPCQQEEAGWGFLINNSYCVYRYTIDASTDI